ncbi:MAG: NAD-dependent deacetylase [Myxococcales bacterium]|nr:NAD-dependent deacetylase [Myxococcales bacterium]
MDEQTLEKAAEAVRHADALLIGAGAGMGVDSGLPDFRGDQGFWKAYPPFAKLGLSFIDLANPRWFWRDASLAWGFYGHRMHLYRDTMPHEGFSILRRWGEKMSHGAFVYTSNIDGQFQKAGFSEEQVIECHGTLHYLQCAVPCKHDIWSAKGIEVSVDPTTFRAEKPLPQCPHCKQIARPNVLMFGDGMWLAEHIEEQEKHFLRWAEDLEGKNLVVVECGAGGAIPTVRMTCERYMRKNKGTLIRINPREPEGPKGTLSFTVGALAALAAIDERLS